eukprot:5529689-Pyramimonas_sp.AAC.1
MICTIVRLGRHTHRLGRASGDLRRQGQAASTCRVEGMAAPIHRSGGARGSPACARQSAMDPHHYSESGWSRHT